MLNPITYTEKVVGDFLRYQLTTYPFADERLLRQMRRLLNLEETRNTPLLQGPFISLSQAFAKGDAVAALVARGVLHPHLASLTPYEHVYAHQQRAFEALHAGRTTLVATGTGSGKTECFLYPIISHCLRLRDEGAAEGIVAVLVYPMNALAEDQLGRLRELLAGSGVSFGMYVGKTPERSSEVAGRRLPEGSTREDYLAAFKKLRAERQGHAVHPPEERVSRDEMRQAGKHPRILLTNVKQLELLLTRQRDVELFDDASLRFLVFDEAHTFSGAQGGETACLIRRLRDFCGKAPDEVMGVATSATIADPERGPEAGREFAARFFGVDPRRVELVGETYEQDAWAAMRSVPGPLPGSAAVQLKNVLEALAELETVGDEPPSAAAVKGLQRVFQGITGQKLDARRWRESLYERLSENELAFFIAEALRAPRHLAELVKELATKVGRPVPEEEVLVWLALGAISRHEGRPLLRPVVHVFVRGMSGAVVTFPEGPAGPQLWLSREEAIERETAGHAERKLDVTTCTTCGQHYFAHWLEDFAFTDKAPSGGQAEGDEAHWRALDEANGGVRVLLTDGIVGAEDENEGDEENAPARTAVVHLCRTCGAVHRSPAVLCAGCGRSGALVRLLAIQQKAGFEGKLGRCLACGATGRRMGSNYREPARPVRAITVSDVHVLAQNMLQHAERRRLIIFADNRQDAAFQAGWMQDHARRYRLRALMFERIEQGPTSVGDLVAWLDKTLEGDDELSLALIPEVWRVARKELAGTTHADERRYFLRIQVLREATNGLRQRIGLEPWGRVKMRYLGLEPGHAFFKRWAPLAACSAEALCDGVASLLDISRRGGVLYDREHELFTRWWSDGDREVQRGYLAPSQGGPKGLVLEREGDESERLGQWLSLRGQTRATQLAKRWLPEEQVRPFLEALWTLLTDELQLLVPVSLRNKWGGNVPGTSGARQVDADRLLLESHNGLWRCTTCRRTQLREGPQGACLQWRCGGTVEHLEEDPDNYDLHVLDEKFALVRAREHSAQVPAEDREALERQFKGDGERVNTLVATPTLELGVDIGALDAVLMRNVPPLAANYWQRAGRAGRRHRMAVNLTYAGSRSHDRSYFHDPLKLLGGRIDPPRFNLRNEPMVRKHVHATVVSELYRLARPDQGLPEAERKGIEAVLATAFPEQIRGYLFTATGNVRHDSFDLGSFTALIERYEDRLLEVVVRVFSSVWPADDSDIVEPERLRLYLREMTERLGEVVQRLKRRLDWALSQLERLDEVRKAKGALESAEEALHKRCDRMVKKLKGMQQRQRREAEGYDDTLSYSVLAAEGFLPGYGLDNGSVLAYHQAPRSGALRDFQFRRDLAMALREYSPGNFLYANGHRFYPRFYHLEAVNEGGVAEPLLFQVDVTNEAVVEHGVATREARGLGAELLPAVPICDVDLPHQSHIADDEDYRFQLPVAVFGYEQGRHGGGRAYRWGPRDVQLRRQIHLRLVNVGAKSLVRDSGHFGYPVCLVCGQSRSPFSSQTERDNFSQTHLERCGQVVRNVGFYADEAADGLSLSDCANKTEAHSLAEALRTAAAQVLEMEREDLHVLVIARPGVAKVDAILYDPMSGGSGLLDQMVQRWGEVVAAARKLTAECPSQCDSACVDCLMHYRNAWSHSQLNRHVVVECLDAWGAALTYSHDIPPKLPAPPVGPLPVNEAEAVLEDMLGRAGLPSPQRQKTIEMGMPLGATTPDFFYEDPTDRFEGLCIYLDGLSRTLHGNPDAQRRDNRLREELRARDYEVLAIAASHLTDRGEMANHFGRIARFLMGKEMARKVRDDTTWFVVPTQGGAGDDADAWGEALELADEAWKPLLVGLRALGVEAPDEVDWDIPVSGRVSGAKAVVVWHPEGEWVGLVGPDDDVEAPGLLRSSPDANPEELASRLRARLGGADIPASS
ncbi:MAG: DEAD/DEAH box helicase [Myxococcota bacterium]|jgi:ATP-dependent helicase YprA (DUF1998 family)|nr:DEAD/DEAH box helicase [Myxococcota bacterium]